MKQTRPIDSTTYTSRPRTIDGLTAAKRWNWLGVSIPRAGWTDPDERLEVRVEYSTDGGNTWTHCLGFVASGGSGGESTAQTDSTPPEGADVRLHVRAIGTKPVSRDIRLIEDDETPTLRQHLEEALRAPRL